MWCCFPLLLSSPGPFATLTRTMAAWTGTVPDGGNASNPAENASKSRGNASNPAETPQNPAENALIPRKTLDFRALGTKNLVFPRGSAALGEYGAHESGPRQRASYP